MRQVNELFQNASETSMRQQQEDKENQRSQAETTRDNREQQRVAPQQQEEVRPRVNQLKQQQLYTK